MDVSDLTRLVPLGFSADSARKCARLVHVPNSARCIRPWLVCKRSWNQRYYEKNVCFVISWKVCSWYHKNIFHDIMKKYFLRDIMKSLFSWYHNKTFMISWKKYFPDITKLFFMISWKKLFVIWFNMATISVTYYWILRGTTWCLIMA